MGEFRASAHKCDWRAAPGFTWIAFTQPADLRNNKHVRRVKKWAKGFFTLFMQNLVHNEQTGYGIERLLNF